MAGGSARLKRAAGTVGTVRWLSFIIAFFGFPC